MKIGFVVNEVATEQPFYTTVRLALAATRMGHQASFMGLGDFAFEPEGSLSGLVRRASPKTKYTSLEDYLAAVQDAGAERHVDLGELDVVMLRSDPAEDAVERPWGGTAGIAS